MVPSLSKMSDGVTMFFLSQSPRNFIRGTQQLRGVELKLAMPSKRVYIDLLANSCPLVFLFRIQQPPSAILPSLTRCRHPSLFESHLIYGPVSSPTYSLSSQCRVSLSARMGSSVHSDVSHWPFLLV